MAAQLVPHQLTEKKRVKVYELRSTDWFDRGTGFCTAGFRLNGEGLKEPRVIVESEENPGGVLLETTICKEDGFHRQQETLIVWTEPTNSLDMALSFQESDGCRNIWKFINLAQRYLASHETVDWESLEETFVDPVSLPQPTLANLDEIDHEIRTMSNTTSAREALCKFINKEQYIKKLAPLLNDAEDMESLHDLHRLCNIMKMVIFLNDANVIEQAVSSECFMGVVGALEYDPDFPSHKANHRQWLQHPGRYREVVPIQDDTILNKVHQTYRLQYLKDVALARILDDTSYSMLNTLVFYNQIEILRYVQANGTFLSQLFAIFKAEQRDPRREKDAVLFIQQCCEIVKNLQPQVKQALYNNLIAHGILAVIHFALRHRDLAVRVGATAILVLMTKDDPQMIRTTIYRQLHEKQRLLTDALIDLLLVEADPGIRSEISEVLKVLLTPDALMPPDMLAKAGGEMPARVARTTYADHPQQEHYLELFYEHSAVRLFRPLIELEGRTNMDFTVPQASLFTYLIEILCFFIGQHQHRSKFFVHTHHIVERVAQLLNSREKFLQLVAIRFIRQLIGAQDDDFFAKLVADSKVLGPILDLLIQTLPRDNLLSSACFEFFHQIKEVGSKDLMKTLGEEHRDKLEQLADNEIFSDLLRGYDESRGYSETPDNDRDTEDDMERKRENERHRFGGLMEHISMDHAEEEYFNTSDDEDEEVSPNGDPSSNGAMAVGQLVDYASDEEVDDDFDGGNFSAGIEGKRSGERMDNYGRAGSGGLFGPATPPERLSEKRRREEAEDEEDDLSKLLQHKRRNSSAERPSLSDASAGVRKRRSTGSPGPGNASKKIAISLPSFKATAQPSVAHDEI